MQLTKLFSDIGGIIGLWIGCSVFSLIEFLELGLDLIVLAIYKASKKKYWGRSKQRISSAKSRSINPSASGNVLGTMTETNLNGERISGGNGSQPSTRYGGFVSRRNSLRNLSSRQNNMRGGGADAAMAGSVNTGFQLPGIILEDMSEDRDMANMASGSAPQSYNYYNSKKHSDKSHRSYLSRMTSLARKPLSSVGSRMKKDRSPPPSELNREGLPHVEGGLRLALSQMYDESNNSVDKNKVRHRGPFSDGNPPFNFM